MKPGDKVICIDDAHHNEFKGAVIPNWIKKGDEYTIREIFDNDGIGPYSILLEEIRNPIVPIPALKVFREPAFAIWRFEKRITIANEETIKETIKLAA